MINIKKIISKLKSSFYIIAAILLLITIRLFKYFKIIRISKIDFARIGTAYNLDWYITEKKFGVHKGSLDIFFEANLPVANHYWKNLWIKKLNFYKFNKIFLYYDIINKKLYDAEKFQIPSHGVYLTNYEYHNLNKEKKDKLQIKLNRRITHILNNTNANIKFSDQEKKNGNKILSDLGIPLSKKYICFHARDASYFDQLYLNFKWPEYDQQRRDRTHDYRDSDINTYSNAIVNLTKNGIYCIRTGSVVKDKLLYSNDMIIDYSMSEYQSEFADIYINSNCYFFLGSDSGMNVFSDVQDIPFVGVNFTEVRRIFCWIKNGVFIFKKFFDTEKNRLLNFSEIINFDFKDNPTKALSDKKIKLINNTNQEILDVSNEMYLRLENKWNDDEESIDIQNKFWKLFDVNLLKSGNLYIGSKYLKENKELIK